VSNDFFNTAGHNGTNVLLLGTDNNNGTPGTFRLHFSHQGRFIITAASTRISIATTSRLRRDRTAGFKTPMVTSAPQ